MTDSRPLAGIRVFELGIAIAGPTCGRYLAHFGAEVFRVESRLNPEPGRMIGAGWLPRDRYGIEVWMDSSPASNENMAGKKGVGIDLKSPQGSEVAKRLLGKCDVLVSNYSADAMEGLGLDYESVRAMKPDIIYVLMSGFGMSPGPYHSFLAYGPNQAPLIGIDDLTGWPDRPPTGIANCSYPDFANAGLATFAILASLAYRDRTGKGQCIDLAQFEGTTTLLGPLLLDTECNGHSPTRMGNRHPYAAPQGVYPCRGNDRWVAISALTEEDWLALCVTAEHPEWTEDSRFSTIRERLDHQDELDDLIAEWTRRHTAPEVAEWLQQAGVAAAPVHDNPGLAMDQQLAARDFWILADDKRFGKDLATGNPIHLSETPGYHTCARPALGQDTEQVLRDVCNYSEDEIEAMIEKRVIFPMARKEITLERPYLSWIRHIMPQLPWPEPGSAAK